MRGNRRITPWVLASVPIASTLAASNLRAAPSSSCAISLSPIPDSPSTHASPSSPATATKRSPDANSQISDSYFLHGMIHFVVSYRRVHPPSEVLVWLPARNSLSALPCFYSAAQRRSLPTNSKLPATRPALPLSSMASPSAPRPSKRNSRAAIFTKQERPWARASNIP